MFERACIKLRCVLNKLDVVAVPAADLIQMPAVGAVLAADDDHGAAIFRHFFGLCLTGKRRTAYCIKYFRICTQFFYDFLTFKQFFSRLRRLDDHC